MHWLIGQRLTFNDHLYRVVGRTPGHVQLELLARKRGGVWHLQHGRLVASYPVRLVTPDVLQPREQLPLP